METTLVYAHESEVEAGDDRDRLRLFSNLLRGPTNLDARVRDVLPFRDAMLALRDCVVSELHVSPEEIAARQLDPLITVTPERVFFEAFSIDESSYARITMRAEAFADVRALAPGCTNVEFSPRLWRGLQSLRSSRPVTVQVERDAFSVASEGATVRERRIDLPESWLDGFLQIQAALRLPAPSLTLHPGDLANVLAYLKRRRAHASPRSLRFRLAPGTPPSVAIEPWGDELVLRRSRYDGAEPDEVRVWGRRRLLILDKVLSHTKHVRVLLHGTGMPSFWICELGAMSFALGLSPWTSREWTGSESYHLSEAPADVTGADTDRALAYAGGKSFVFASELADALGRSASDADAVLNRLCLDGRVLFDLETGAYFLRDVLPGREPALPRSNRREADARALVASGGVVVESVEADGARVSGRVRGRRGEYRTSFATSASQRIDAAFCECEFHARHGMTRGPCKHVLALRLAVDDERTSKNGPEDAKLGQPLS